MGIYINPKDRSKELWLRDHAIRLPSVPNSFRTDEGIAICLVDNGGFTAAAVAYSQRELEAFTSHDGRPKTWWRASIADLSAVLGYDFGKDLERFQE